MKKFTKVIALILSLTLLLCFPIGVSAAEPEDTGVDTAAKGSLTIYKVDLTSAEKDGAWDSSYVSTGVYDQNVNDTLNSYALKDVEFTYLRVADVVQLTGSAADGADSDHVETLYGISKTAGADLLNALGLGNGANRYEKADGSDQLDDSKYYYQSDVLISALSTALKANATTVKNALEAYVTESGTAMPLTDTYGKTKAENLELGLYLVVETRVPEMVTSTCNPFFICLPMTSSGGSWIYDVTVYPKNLTGNPTLDKTLRESKDDTGKHIGTNDIDDGYAETGTASDGDSVDYQIISTLPSITSASTYLTCYTFADTLSRGITYNKHDVVLEFFTDAACTDSVAKWAETDGKFTVTYSSTDTGESGMTIEMTADGLKEMNTAVYSNASMVNSGYSDCTLRITYAATVNSSADVVYGDNGNPNEVVLTWKRTSQNSYDTLKDDAKVFTYGLELTKLFSDGKGDFSKVQFIMQNKTDGYYVKAKLDEATGVYYVTSHVTDKKDATRFVPTAKDGKGKILIKNTGQLPMYLIQNNHPAIVSREIYRAVQAERTRRSASASPSKKMSSTGRSCYASKFALSERLVCGECGTLYRRCTWKRNGKARVVWRCVSRLDYGAKYCHQSPTMDEEPLQRAIMAAINSVVDPKETISRQITEAAVEETGILPDSTMTLGEINRRREELEAEFNVLLQQPDSAAKNAEKFGSIANEMASLKEQREKIAARLRKDQAVQSHVHTMEAALDGMSHLMQQWDEEMIRQLVHTVKVISADHIKVYLYDGTEIDQTVNP